MKNCEVKWKKNQAGNQRRMIPRIANDGRNNELEKMRKELGAIGGAGHLWENDKNTSWPRFSGWSKN